MNTHIDGSDIPNESPDGSTNISEEQKEYTEQLSDGSDTDAPDNKNLDDSEHDTASGGDADE
jgi:hypothetical protein